MSNAVRIKEHDIKNELIRLGMNENLASDLSFRFYSHDLTIKDLENLKENLTKDIENSELRLKNEIDRLDSKIENVKLELKSFVKEEINTVKSELKEEINTVNTRIDTVKSELKEEINTVKSELKEVKKEINDSNEKLKLEFNSKFKLHNWMIGIVITLQILAFGTLGSLLISLIDKVVKKQ